MTGHAPQLTFHVSRFTSDVSALPDNLAAAVPHKELIRSYPGAPTQISPPKYCCRGASKYCLKGSNSEPTVPTV